MQNKIRSLVEVLYVIASLITIFQFWQMIQNYKQKNNELKSYRLEVISNQKQLQKDISYLIPLAKQGATRRDEKQKIEKIKVSLQQESHSVEKSKPKNFSDVCKPTIFSGCNEPPCELMEKDIGIKLNNFQWGAIRNDDGWVSIFQKRNNIIKVVSKFHEPLPISATYLNQDQKEGDGAFYSVRDGLWLFECKN